MLRIRGTVPPCNTCPKIPPDAPAKSWMFAVDLTPQNLEVYWHYKECRAVGRFPRDPLVSLHAATIRAVEDQQEELRADARIGRLLALIVR